MADITADVVVIRDGPEHFKIMLVGDGSSGDGSDTAILVDASTLVGANGDERFKITSVRWSVGAGSNRHIVLSWDATATVPALTLGFTGEFDRLDLGNLAHDNAGCTGDLLLSANSTATAPFTIIITGKKVTGYTGITRLKGIGRPH